MGTARQKRQTKYKVPKPSNNQAANDSDAYLSLRFQGQQYDTESGLHYNRHRYYDPELAQYIIADPIGLAGGSRPQGYVSDPVHWVDPLGLAPKKCPPCDQDETRVRHYTNRNGSNGIEESGVIVAQDNNRVYVEPANKKALSQVKAENKYQIGRGRGRDYVETDVSNSDLEWVNNPRYGTPELTVKGNVTLKNPKFTRRK